MNTVRDLHVVTGATAGIGRGIACALAAESRHVVALGRNRAELEALERQHPAHLTGRVLDLLEDPVIATFAAELDHAGTRLRALVHCAGVQVTAELSNTATADMDTLYRTNVRAPFLLTQRLLAALERGQGWLIFINSSAGLAAKRATGAYSALQHAHRALAECWREELNERGIRVLNIYPGRTNTPRIERLFAQEGRPYAPELLLQPADIAALVTLAIALPATVELTDISLRPAKKTY